MKTLVAIPTLFTRDTLKEEIQSLEEQSLKPDKILLITPSGNIGDDWKTFLVKYENIEIVYLEDYSREEVLNKEKNSMVASRNKALEIAREELNEEAIIIFFDDDCVIDSNWVEKAIENLRGDDIAGFTGKVINIRDQGSLRVLEEHGLKLIEIFFGNMKTGSITDCGYVSTNFHGSQRCEVQHLPGVTMAFKINALQEYEFDVNYKGNCYREETDFSVKINRRWKLIYDPSTSVHHFMGKTRRDKFSVYYKNYNHIYFWRKNFKFTFCFFLREGLESIMLIAAFILSLKFDYLYGIKGKIDAYCKYIFS